MSNFNDLPEEPIDGVTLVDTQSMVTQRGINAKTAVQVVDHHPRRPDLPENWQVTLDEVGACTTLFVEGLREHNGALNPIHATLLLLGIYEDTGSLIYADTTARDARAVSFLLEQGASLQIATRYLNPALSAEQRVVYDRILATCETHNLNGQEVIVAAIDAVEMTDEISTVAHKVRDLLDPPALFLLVRTVEGVRLVARSTTDSIDVSAVAAYFGGWRAWTRRGSPGARAIKPGICLTRPRARPRLPRYAASCCASCRSTSARPPPSARLCRATRCCSRPIRRLPKPPQLMQRYGYEGFPVVQDGKVIGLLNRRAVDRADRAQTRI